VEAEIDVLAEDEGKFLRVARIFGQPVAATPVEAISRDRIRLLLISRRRGLVERLREEGKRRRECAA
jgi:hypothetical protein